MEEIKNPDQIKKKIFQEGKIELLITHSKMRQNVEFFLKKIPYGGKTLAFLFTNKPVDSSHLMRIAEQLDFPVEGPGGRFFPKNKKASDFLI